MIDDRRQHVAAADFKIDLADDRPVDDTGDGAAENVAGAHFRLVQVGAEDEMALAAMPSFSPSRSTAPAVMVETISAPLASLIATSALTAPLLIEEMAPLKMLRALMFMKLLLTRVSGISAIAGQARLLPEVILNMGKIHKPFFYNRMDFSLLFVLFRVTDPFPASHCDLWLPE
jgi:hypothetical protein